VSAIIVANLTGTRYISNQIPNLNARRFSPAKISNNLNYKALAVMPNQTVKIRFCPPPI
jgi:hypothetical protein